MNWISGGEGYSGGGRGGLGLQSAGGAMEWVSAGGWDSFKSYRPGKW